MGLSADFEQCIVDTAPYNYEMNIQMTYDEFRLSITQKVPIQYQETSVEHSTNQFVILDGEQLRCFEDVFREKTQQRMAEHPLGSHHITYFYSDGLVAMPDYSYDPPRPIFPLLIAIEPEHFIEIF